MVLALVLLFGSTILQMWLRKYFVDVIDICHQFILRKTTLETGPCASSNQMTGSRARPEVPGEDSLP